MSPGPDAGFQTHPGLLRVTAMPTRSVHFTSLIWCNLRFLRKLKLRNLNSHSSPTWLQVDKISLPTASPSSPRKRQQESSPNSCYGNPGALWGHSGSGNSVCPLRKPLALLPATQVSSSGTFLHTLERLTLWKTPSWKVGFAAPGLLESC